MKKFIIAGMMMLAVLSVYSQDLNSSFSFGVQASSDGAISFILKGWHLEAGLGGNLYLFDDDGMLIAGTYLSWLFNSSDGFSSFGTGIDFKIGVGSNIAEHIDIALRLSYNYHLSKHLMLSGIYYPFKISTRETEDLDDWNMTRTIGSTAIAVTAFF